MVLMSSLWAYFTVMYYDEIHLQASHAAKKKRLYLQPPKPRMKLWGGNSTQDSVMDDQDRYCTTWTSLLTS